MFLSKGLLKGFLSLIAATVNISAYGMATRVIAATVTGFIADVPNAPLTLIIGSTDISTMGIIIPAPNIRRKGRFRLDPNAFPASFSPLSDTRLASARSLSRSSSLLASDAESTMRTA